MGGKSTYAGEGERSSSVGVGGRSSSVGVGGRSSSAGEDGRSLSSCTSQKMSSLADEGSSILLLATPLATI